MQEMPIREKIFIGGDLNRHVGIRRYGSDSIMEDLILGKEMNKLTRF